jgi:CBS domain-containing protein
MQLIQLFLFNDPSNSTRCVLSFLRCLFSMYVSNRSSFYFLFNIFKSLIKILFLSMTTIVRDIMRKRLETIEDSASVQDAAKKLKDREVSSLIVVDIDGKPQGLITERDIVTKVCTSDTFTSTITNKQIMSVPLITIDSTTTPAVAADMMLQYNVRHLLVIDNNNNSDKSDSKNFVGIITPLDFARYEEFPNDEVDKDEIERMLEYYI